LLVRHPFLPFHSFFELLMIIFNHCHTRKENTHTLTGLVYFYFSPLLFILKNLLRQLPLGVEWLFEVKENLRLWLVDSTLVNFSRDAVGRLEFFSDVSPLCVESQHHRINNLSHLWMPMADSLTHPTSCDVMRIQNSAKKKATEC
jgi:hypothetical protein